ncbi:uncharacterized protein UTRI_04457_B [Ustilago trichophora]|uniref:Uncharacterized protein n=1 Tax=Ustilago trichophora TaxID=86804 RepID=A0A5C3EEJ4_9BASI|nr:uncharacterized protein UTRI_04457_B [Ustilago trichophora]
MASQPPPPPTSSTPQRPHQPSPLSQPPTVTASSTSSSSATQHGGPHQLSLKVMRASAPSLAVSEKPYYDDHFSSSSNPLLKAVGQGIREGLSQDLLSNGWGQDEPSSSSAAESFPISNLLVLPSSFGTLFLGETFRTYLCVRNESDSPVREPSLRVEMQVGSSDPQQQQQQPSPADGVRWHQLAHVILPTPTRYSPEPPSSSDDQESQSKPVWELSPSQPLETTLGYDIKDLGPHVLVCTVGYKSLSPAPEAGGEAVWVERSFRKFYKFSVDRSPISVRTKVHHPRHASALYHPDAKVRGKVSLEVQVQNVAGNGASLVFQGLALKPAHGWKWVSVDRPSLSSDEEAKGKGDMWISGGERGGSNEVLADGDVRQYLFDLYPSSSLSLASEVLKPTIDMGTSPEGHSIRGDPLGHLDISWRMSLGENGRLQTSQLVRRRVAIPPVPIAIPADNGVVGPQVTTRLTLLPEAVETLKKVKAGETVELGVKVEVCDVSGLLLPLKEEGKEEKESSGSDDDTPLSEISPRTRRSATTTTNPSEQGQEITITRTFRLALQHCAISPPPLPSPADTTTHDAAPSTPRKPAVPSSSSRTSTATQPAPSTSSVGGLNKARLQANLTNLVRNSSLSLRPSSTRASVDVTSEESSLPPSINPSPSNTPQPPPVPSKTNLASAAPIFEPSSPSSPSSPTPHQNPPPLPSPYLPWPTLTQLYALHTETHSQALNRPLSSGIPTTFLPTPNLALFQETSLIPLPEIQLEVKMYRATDGKMYRSNGNNIQQDVATVQSSLKFILTDAIAAQNQDGQNNAKVLRFGAVRIILLAYGDKLNDDPEEKQFRECMTVLQDIPVFAEALLLPY